MGKVRPLSKAQVTESVPKQSGVYDILDRNGTVSYVGSAAAGRPQARLLEHLADDDVPGGTQFRFRPTGGTAEARAIERNRIAELKPRHNKSGT